MRVFLLSVLAVIVIGVGAWLILEGGLRRNSGTAFALSSARVNEADKPDPRGNPAIQRGRPPPPSQPATHQ